MYDEPYYNCTLDDLTDEDLEEMDDEDFQEFLNQPGGCQ